jgi:hypothetical protein
MQTHVFLTSALVGVSGRIHVPAALIPLPLDGPQSRFGEFLTARGLELRPLSPRPSNLYASAVLGCPQETATYPDVIQFWPLTDETQEPLEP